MKLARKLEHRLNKLFFLSIGVGVVALFLITYVSTRQLKQRAIDFISSHVSQISFAEINSQNVSEIDRAVRRLYEAWRGTQDIDIKIDVFLDGKLVGQAGQLQSFGLFSVRADQIYNLPSGQDLTVKLEFDLTGLVQTDILILLVFLIFFSGCYVLLRKSLSKTIREITSPLEDRVAWLTEVSKTLPESIRGKFEFESSIDELKSLDLSLEAFTRQILLLEEKVSKASFAQGRLKMAEQLAHNLKGSLAVLQLRINNSGNLKDSEKERLLSAVNEVSNAARILLKTRKSDTDSVVPLITQKLEALPFRRLLMEMIETKKETLGARNITITCDLALGAEIAINATQADFESLFGNLIDNSIEAVNSSGTVAISAKTQGNSVIVRVRDNGCGVPASLIPMLMTEGFTHGKTEGNGFGLYHSKCAAEKMGGTVEIESKEGVGTEVTVCVPWVSQDKTQLKIDFLPSQTVVITDDDQLIHGAFDLKLSAYPKLNVVHLYSIEEFENWIRENGAGDLGSRVYLMDYDLRHRSQTGIDLIKRFNLQLEAILITGMAGEYKVQELARQSGIRLVSKDEISNIVFNFINVSEHQNTTSDVRLSERGS